MASPLSKHWTRLRPSACALVIFCCCICNASLRAAPPVFSDPAVSAYILELTRFRDHYLAATKQAALGDDRAMLALNAQFPALQARATPLLDKLQPRETKLFTEYVARCAQSMVDAAFGLSRMPTAAGNKP